jgi:RimJ/RimL family protein N-acetyltransferase
MSTLVAASPADWPVPLTSVQLHGKIVLLETLVPEHEHELSQISQDPQIWRYLTSYGGAPDALHRYLSNALYDYSSGSALPFVIRTASDRRLIGMTRLKNLSREHRNAVVGSWLAPCAWGRGINTEAKLLLLEHAFKALHCIRIEFHADSRNLRSRAALTKMGALEEGTLRSCIIMRDGFRRDTVVFSVLEHEWPKVRERLRTRLRVQLANQAAENRST